MLNKKIKVIVVDDSALIRALLNKVLDDDDRLDVVATAKDAYEARELIKKYNPDVITLDIEMPKMNGIEFLERVMRLRPMPVVMISTLTQEGAPETLRALEIGAVDFIAKPKTGNAQDLGNYAQVIIEKVVTAARAKIRTDTKEEQSRKRQEASERIRTLSSSRSISSSTICAIGSSTGGTEAIKDVVSVLPENAPPIVIAQHIPESFSASFAKRVDGISKVSVFEAAHNQPILPGCVYISPGHSHLTVVKDGGGKYVCNLDENPPVNRHRPSVEVLFDSVREVAGRRSLAIMLTGMGADGAEAMLRMKQAGIYTVAQNEETCVVWGMPGAAVKMGAVDKQLPLPRIADFIMTHDYN